jgi:hypothetical protein
MAGEGRGREEVEGGLQDEAIARMCEDLQVCVYVSVCLPFCVSVCVSVCVGWSDSMHVRRPALRYSHRERTRRTLVWVVRQW